MPKWRIIIAEYKPLTAANRFLGSEVFKEGDPRPYTVHAGDVVDGVEVDGWIKTHFDGVRPDEVYIPIQGHAERLDAPLSPEPIRSDEHDAFCVEVTNKARHYETDRNYLMAWAFLGTNNLQEMGQPGDGKIGPFQFSAEEWAAAIKGPAKNLSLSVEARRGWPEQILVATLVLKDCVQRLESALGEMPTRLEVYFAQKFGPGAEDVLKQPRTALCRDHIKNAPAAGTYAAELANSDKTIQQALDDLRPALESAFKAAYTLIDAQPPEIRLFDESDLPPAAGDSAPWLKVAAEQMNKGVTRDAGDKNSAEIQAYFEGTGVVPGPREAWCGAFVTYCMQTCGVPEVVSSIVSGPATAASWKNWGKAATEKPQIGSVVVLKPQERGSSGHVGFLYELSDDGKKIKLLAGNQKKRGEDHNHVGVVEFPVEGDKGVDSYRWLEVAQPAATIAGGAPDPGGALIARWDGKPQGGQWSRFVLEALERHGAELLNCKPSDIGDIRDFCPDFPDDEARRARFWLYLLSCIAEEESSFDPNITFAEPGELTGVTSAGLLQLSVGDARGYGCDFTTEQDVLDPAKNLSCGVRIMQRWVVRDNVISGISDGSHKGGSRYWAVLRPGRKFERIKARCSRMTF